MAYDALEIYGQVSSPLVASLLTTHPNQVTLGGRVPDLWSSWWDWAAEHNQHHPPKWTQLLEYYCRPLEKDASIVDSPSTVHADLQLTSGQIPPQLCRLIDTVRDLQLSREPICSLQDSKCPPCGAPRTRGRSPSSFGMSPKKEHEVSRMASFIRDLLSQDSRHRSAQHVVDVGSGQGYLSRALKEQGLHVLALDSDESQTSSADKWRVKDSLRRAHEQRRAAFQNGCITAIRPPFPPAPTVSVENGSLTHRTVHIQQQSLEVAIVEWLHSGAHDISSPFQEPIPIVFVALHACGSLTVDILRTFLAQQDKTKNGSQRTWEPHSLVVVGCCYNLISPSDFPLSKSLRALSPPPTLPIAALHLATQVPAHWFRTERSGKDAYLAVRKVVYRALLHPVLLLAARYRRSHEARDDSENVRNGDGDETAVHLGLGETPGNRRLGKLNNTSYVNWATFLSCAVTKMDIDLPILVRHHLEGEPDTEDLLPPWILYNGHDGGDREQRSTQERLETESRLEVLHVLRCILGPLVETLILLDRYEWLRDELEAVEGESEVERKWKVDMINLFDQATGSGRNIALVVRPAPGQ